jgi:calcium-dependent protein kinase
LESDYVVTDEILGKGMNGGVKLGFSQSCPNQKVAVKELRYHGVAPSKREMFESEAEVFLSMDHPHIARLLDVYEYETHIALVMECIEGGELYDRLVDVNYFAEQDAATAVWQMLLALSYIHSRSTMHGDIKLENWMYQSTDNRLKLIDFGFSKMCEGKQSLREREGKLRGTLEYIAPEAIEMKCTSQNDQWSLGVVVYVLLCGQLPFSGRNRKERIRNISKGCFSMDAAPWKIVSCEAKSFVRALLELDPAMRLTSHRALDHPFLASCRSPRVEKRDPSIVRALQDFQQQSKFRRICLSLCAWSLSTDERAKVEKHFLAMIDNKQGTITYDELKKLMVDECHMTVDEFTKAFSALAIHNVHEICYSDFLAAMVSTSIALNDDHLLDVFRKLDRHDEGIVTLEDLREVLGDDVYGERVETYLREVDHLDRGYITFHEFSSYVRGRPLKWHGDESASTHVGGYSRGRSLKDWTGIFAGDVRGRTSQTWQPPEKAEAACCTLQ